MSPEEDGEVDELRVLLDQSLELVLVNVLESGRLEEQSDFGTTAQRVSTRVLGNGKLALCRGFPDELFVRVVFGDDADLVSDQVSRVEADTKFADEIHVGGVVFKGLQEVRGAGLGEGAEVLDEFLPGHADARVGDGDFALFLVSPDFNLQIGVFFQGVLFGEREETDLVEGIGSV